MYFQQNKANNRALTLKNREATYIDDFKGQFLLENNTKAITTDFLQKHVSVRQNLYTKGYVTTGRQTKTLK